MRIAQYVREGHQALWSENGPARNVTGQDVPGVRPRYARPFRGCDLLAQIRAAAFSRSVATPRCGSSSEPFVKWAGANLNRGYGHPKAEGYQATPPARSGSNWFVAIGAVNASESIVDEPLRVEVVVCHGDRLIGVNGHGTEGNPSIDVLGEGIEIIGRKFTMI